MSGLFSRYTRVATNDLPSNTAEVHRPSPKPAFGRARTRWALIAGCIFVLLLFIGLFSSDPDSSWKQKAGQYAGKIGPGGWSWSKPTPPISPAEQLQVNGKEMDRWVKGSGRPELNYYSPFNPEDLTLTEDECDAFFPGLWYEIDRSVQWFTKHQ